MPTARPPSSTGRSSSSRSMRPRPRRASTAPSPAASRLALGLVAGAKLANLPMFFGSYPITPASPILHALARLKEFGVTTFQAEDEIAAICSAIGASYAGQLGVTSSSRPRHRAQGRGARPRDHHRAAARDRQLAARRAVDRAADQDRAERPVPGGLRPQRRRPARGAGVALADRTASRSRSRRAVSRSSS